MVLTDAVMRAVGWVERMAVELLVDLVEALKAVDTMVVFEELVLTAVAWVQVTMGTVA